MDHTEAKQRIAELTEQLNRYNYEYYMNDTSLVSDFEFDKLLEELAEKGMHFTQIPARVALPERSRTRHQFD